MQVEIWSDVMCPWCAVGKARFERALGEFPHADEVEVRWRSFELDPDAPAEKDGDYVGRLAEKYGTSQVEAQRMIDTMTATGAGEGLDFRFDRVRPGNTFDAHRLLHLAHERGLQHELKERFLTAYLNEGEAVGRADVLRRLATEVGLDEVEVDDVLAGDAYADAVRGDERQAMAYGIRGVPFFVLDGRLGVSGAQPAEALLGALTQAYGPPAPLVTHDHDHEVDGPCVDGRCAV